MSQQNAQTSSKELDEIRSHALGHSYVRDVSTMGAYNIYARGLPAPGITHTDQFVRCYEDSASCIEDQLLLRDAGWAWETVFKLLSGKPCVIYEWISIYEGL